jgi:MFS transporter, CP family, cyanate transporter
MAAPRIEDGDRTADAPEGTPHPFRWAVLSGVWLAYYCFGLTSVALAPLVGVIGDDLGLGHSAMGTVLGAWQLVYIGSAIPCGVFLDRFGPRKALLVALLVIAASAALRGMATGHASLFLAVAVFGFGGPMVSIGAPKLISLWFDGRERGLAMGLYMTGPALGAMTGLSLTNGVMMRLFEGNWRSVLFAYAVVVLAAALVWFGLTAHGASRDMERRLAAEPRESQLRVFADLIRIPAVRIVLAMSIGIFLFNHGLNNWLPEILRSQGLTAAMAGYWASIPVLVGVASSITIPRLATPPRRMKILLGLFLAAAGATLMLKFSGGPLLAGGLVLQGIARGAMMTLAILTLLDIPEVGSRRAGLAGGLFFSAAEVGGVLGPVSIGLISDLSGGFDAALAMLTGICVALVLLLAWLRRVSA